ncbi:MAG: PAS domain S-box protein [Candidatus Hydrogenedentes bacterium]|nr:PAS domain S-box protein [Candidatus Hydrogenedentota bacterium]
MTVRASAAPVRDASGKTLAAVTTVYDITERKQAEERRHFADEAGRLLSSSLDYEWTLRALAHLAVPRIADWCAVDMLDEDGALQRLEVVHVDPAKVEYAHELQRRYPVDRNAPRGLAAILRTGAPEFIPVISEELLAATARDQEQLRIIRELGLHSYIGVPLIARERVLGALTLVSAESARTYTEADLEFALELARRAAAAVDNAQLYTAAQREIAERQEAEAALRASEERLRFTLEAAHVGTWNWNMRTNKLEWSENLLKIHGLSQDAFGGTFADFQNDIHPDDRGMVEAAIQRAIQGGGTYQVEYRLDPSGDALTWVEGKGRVIFDEKGQPAGMAGICMDVTERRLAEQRFRAAVESSPSAMVLVDAHGRIALVNTQTEFLFGYERQELLGQSIELLVPQRFRMAHPMFRAHFHAQPQARPMGMGRELFGLRKDGSEFPTEIALNPIQMPDGLYVLSTILDITERKRAEAALRQVNLELQQKNADLEQFVYTVSHDLKSPLVTVSGFIGLLREELAENQREEVYDCLDRLERATVRMGDLIDDLLELSRIGRVERPRVVCDTGRVMREIGEELVDRFHAAQARLVIQEGLPRLFIDPMRFTEVFENLLTNAIKYGCDRPDTQIEVGCEMDEAECRFFVRDEGPGIAPEYHERIFGLFQRLDTRNEGTGVGLAIVARIVQLAAGRAWVESAPGKGATFWAAFPRSLVRT